MRRRNVLAAHRLEIEDVNRLLRALNQVLRIERRPDHRVRKPRRRTFSGKRRKPPARQQWTPGQNCMKRRRLAARANPDIMALPVAKHAVYLTMILQQSGLATWFVNSRLAVQARPALDVVRPARCLLLCVGLMIGALGARAEVTHIEIASRTDVLGGRSFGDTGPYEKIVGKVFFAVDPNDPANKHIVDIDKAARDAAGRVSFSADLYALIPKDAAPATAWRWSMCSIAVARTCSLRSTERRRGPTRRARRISATAS